MQASDKLFAFIVRLFRELLSRPATWLSFFESVQSFIRFSSYPQQQTQQLSLTVQPQTLAARYQHRIEELLPAAVSDRVIELVTTHSEASNLVRGTELHNTAAAATAVAKFLGAELDSMQVLKKQAELARESQSSRRTPLSGQAALFLEAAMRLLSADPAAHGGEAFQQLTDNIRNSLSSLQQL